MVWQLLVPGTQIVTLVCSMLRVPVSSFVTWIGWTLGVVDCATVLSGGGAEAGAAPEATVAAEAGAAAAGRAACRRRVAAASAATAVKHGARRHGARNIGDARELSSPSPIRCPTARRLAAAHVRATRGR